MTGFVKVTHYGLWVVLRKTGGTTEYTPLDLLELQCGQSLPIYDDDSDVVNAYIRMGWGGRVEYPDGVGNSWLDWRVFDKEAELLRAFDRYEKGTET